MTLINDTSLQAMVDTATAVFREHFEHDPAVLAIAPGRVNLIGEHTDYNDGFVFPMAIERQAVLVASVNNSGRCRLVAADLDNEMASFTIEGIAPSKGHWSTYIKGVVAQFLDNGHPVPGFDAVLTSNVPLGGGLSSSAAIEVCTATMIEQFLGIQIDPKRKALWCQKAEHDYAGVPCGIMDQFISALGEKDHALLIDCRSQDTEQFPLDDPNIEVLITNSNFKHSLDGGEYAERRSQCEAAAKVLGVKFLRDATMDQLVAARDQMDDVTFRRARHVISENDRTQRAADALRRANYAEFGRLMVESHHSLRDDFEVSVPEIDTLVELACEVDGVYGSRITGGGFGGCTVTLVKTEAAQTVIDHVMAGYRDKHGVEATCFTTHAGPGARGTHLG